MSQFREAYSNLIRAAWEDPGLTASIASDPSKLKQYGFSDIPSKVTFEEASGKASVAGYDDQLNDANDGSVTFYIPPKPELGAAPGSNMDVELGGDACCCCCPCCTCT